MLIVLLSSKSVYLWNFNRNYYILQIFSLLKLSHPMNAETYFVTKS